MSATAWLDSRTPPAPQALLARVRAALGNASGGDENSACLGAATTLLEQILNGDATGRETALDLLAADALVTYAFEAAAANAENLERRSADAMRQLAALDGAAARPSS